MSYTNNWTQIIRQLMTESHTKEELMKLSNAELKKLHGEYSGKDDEKSQDEAKVIKSILDERGDDKEDMKEAYIGEFFGFGKKKPDPKPKAEIKPGKPVKKQPKPKLDPNAMDYALGVGGKYNLHNHVEHQGNDLQEQIALNEHLLSLIEALCEKLGIDVETLLENADPIGRFSSASKGASSSTPDTSERKRKIQDQMAVIKHRMEHGTEKERDWNTDEYYYLEKRLKKLQQELSALSEDFTTPEREDKLTQGVLSAVARGDHSRAEELVKRLDDENADTGNVYGIDGKKLRSREKLKAAGFHKVPGTKKRNKKR